MNHAPTPQWKRCRQLIPLLFAMILLSCKSHDSDIEVELDAGKEFIITVKNGSDDLLDVDDRLLGLGIESSVKVEVAHPDGAIIPLCRHIDYVGSRKPLPVVPHGESIISIPLSAITLTHCLPVNERYMFRAALVSGGEIVSRTDQVAFRAVSPLTDGPTKGPE